ncbi:MAG: hypothetical protein AAF797_06050 [Planctomycetota bacterium]
MSDPGQLLRMLEPAVRPVATPPTAGAPKPANTPFESQSFDQLLQQASTNTPNTEPPKPTPGPTEPAKPANTFQPLSGIDRIENQSLRDLIAAATHQPNKPAA